MVSGVRSKPYLGLGTRIVFRILYSVFVFYYDGSFDDHTE